jgi:hypothetical protein
MMIHVRFERGEVTSRHVGLRTKLRIESLQIELEDLCSSHLGDGKRMKHEVRRRRAKMSHNAV